MSERLTLRTEKGAALKLDNPKSEKEAKQQLMEKYKIAVEKLAYFEDLEEVGLDNSTTKLIENLSITIKQISDDIIKIKSKLGIGLEEFSNCDKDNTCEMCVFYKNNNNTLYCKGQEKPCNEFIHKQY